MKASRTRSCLQMQKRPPPSAQDAKDGAPKEVGHIGRKSTSALLRVAVVGHVSYVERLVEAKIEPRFGRDAKRFDF